jgi:hypothetical protein
MTQIEAAVGQLAVALQAYAAAVTETPSLPRDVVAASDRVRAAGTALQDAVAEVSGWHIELFLPADGSAAEPEPGNDRLPLAGQGLAVRMRADFVVTDLGRLLAAGRAAYRELWPAEPEQAAQQRVDRAEAAVGELLHRHPAGPLAGMDLAGFGLAEAGTVTAVDPVAQVLDNGVFPDWPEDPFTVG